PPLLNPEARRPPRNSTGLTQKALGRRPYPRLRCTSGKFRCGLASKTFLLDTTTPDSKRPEYTRSPPNCVGRRNQRLSRRAYVLEPAERSPINPRPHDCPCEPPGTGD